jgi:hypothetical protein
MKRGVVGERHKAYVTSWQSIPPWLDRLPARTIVSRLLFNSELFKLGKILLCYGHGYLYYVTANNAYRLLEVFAETL